MITFMEVVDSGSILNASKKLGIQFSTAVYHISRVEEYFKITLFHRTATGVSLNDDGKKIYPIISKVLESLEEAKINLCKRNACIKIVMGEIPSIIFLKEFMKRFQDLYPSLKIDIKSMSYNKCIRDINTGNADVAVVGEVCMNQNPNETHDQSMINNNRSVLCTDGFVLITPVNHQLNEKKTCRIFDILKYNLISLPPDYGLEMSIKKELKKRNIKIGKRVKRIVVENLSEQINMVLSGDGIAITSKRVGLILEKLGQVHTIQIEKLDSKRDLYVIFSRYFKGDRLRTEIVSTLSQLC